MHAEKEAEDTEAEMEVAAEITHQQAVQDTSSLLKEVLMQCTDIFSKDMERHQTSNNSLELWKPSLGTSIPTWNSLET